jgi:GNAT superfamily N-acetyltransferase
MSAYILGRSAGSRPFAFFWRGLGRGFLASVAVSPALAGVEFLIDSPNIDATGVLIFLAVLAAWAGIWILAVRPFARKWGIGRFCLLTFLSFLLFQGVVCIIFATVRVAIMLQGGSMAWDAFISQVVFGVVLGGIGEFNLRRMDGGRR